MSFTYPSNDFENSNLLVGLLGSFWSDTYASSAMVESYAGARGELELQTFQNTQELVDSVSRLTVPVYHKRKWYAVTLLESQASQDGASILYSIGSESFWLAGVPVICSSLQSPAVTLVHTTDFLFHSVDQTIAFRNDPFDNPLIETKIIYNSAGQPSDRELTLWLFRVEVDKEYIYEQFGYVLDIKLPSSETYRNLLNHLFDTIVGGPSDLAWVKALSLIANLPVVEEESETVEDIIQGASSLMILTDKKVYKYSSLCTPSVGIGDLVYQGDSLVEELRIDYLHSGNIPEGLESLTLGSDFLLLELSGELTFLNQNLSTTVTTDEFDYTEIRFPISGDPDDVELFWDKVQENGRDKDETLAMLLDQRINPEGQPVASYLPTSINPLQFLVENLLRNIVLVRVSSAVLEDNALWLYRESILRRLMPPQLAMMLLEI